MSTNDRVAANITTDAFRPALKAEVAARLKDVSGEIEQQQGPTWSPTILRRLELITSLVRGVTA
jgi:hypothetical protein